MRRRSIRLPLVLLLVAGSAVALSGVAMRWTFGAVPAVTILIAVAVLITAWLWANAAPEQGFSVHAQDERPKSGSKSVRIGWLLACVACWAALVGVFTLYLWGVYGGGGVGDRGTLAIIGFVVLGWPTLALGTVFTYLLAANRRRGVPRWGPAATGAGLVVFGIACMIVAATYYVPATLFWLGIPTLGAAALTAAAARK